MKLVEHPTERRSPEPLLYCRAQLQGDARIYLRRRRDKVRFAAHVGAALALVMLSVWWVVSLHSFTGPVLVEFTSSHGVHLGDLPVVAFLCAGAWSVVAAVRMRGVGAARAARSS